MCSLWHSILFFESLADRPGLSEAIALRLVSSISYSPTPSSSKLIESINLKAFENNGCRGKYFSAFGNVSIITGIVFHLLILLNSFTLVLKLQSPFSQFPVSVARLLLIPAAAYPHAFYGKKHR